MVLEQFGADVAEAIFQSNVDADSTGRQRVLARLTAHSPEIAVAILTLLEKRARANRTLMGLICSGYKTGLT